jgi:quinolinate synthase
MTPTLRDVNGQPLAPTGLSTLQLEDEIHRLRRERNAVILAHYYQDADIQDLADFIGDSLDLSRKAASTRADVIVFCGVKFMAEVAKILSPEKIVVLPDLRAGCSLEFSCAPQSFKAFREAHPDHLALTYINCSADVKALSDIIVTSSNAEAIIQQIPATQPILFAPDRHLGAYLMQKTGREMLLWDGSCIVHERFSERELVKLKVRRPDAQIIAHPECTADVLRHADFIGSTSALLKFVQTSPVETFIVATEPGILHQMERAMPHKTFLPAPGQQEGGACIACNTCPYMKMNTLEKLYLCLRDLSPRIEMDESLQQRALAPLERMLAMSPKVKPEAEQVAGLA